jgi:hypothetical protein
MYYVLLKIYYVKLKGIMLSLLVRRSKLCPVWIAIVSNVNILELIVNYSFFFKIITELIEQKEAIEA